MKRFFIPLAVLIISYIAMPFVNADTHVAFRGKVSFQGRLISNAEVYFMNPSGGNNSIATFTDSRGEFELKLQGSGFAQISVLVPSVGKPEFALGNFIVQMANNQIQGVYYDAPPSTEAVSNSSGYYQLELKKPTVILRLVNNGQPVENPVLEPNGFGLWPYLKGNKDGYIGLYVNSCKINCRNYGFFYLQYLEGPQNVVQAANGFAVRINYQGNVDIKDQLGKEVQSSDGVYNLNLLKNSQMPGGSLNIGPFPKGIGPEIKNLVIPNSNLLTTELLKLEFDIASSISLELLDKSGFLHVAIRNKDRTVEYEIPVLKVSQDPFNTHWKGQFSIPSNVQQGKYDLAISLTGFSGPIEKIFESAFQITPSKIILNASPPPKINQIATASPTPTTAGKKSTINCMKGNVYKRITGINPKCPIGYKTK